MQLSETLLEKVTDAFHDIFDRDPSHRRFERALKKIQDREPRACAGTVTAGDDGQKFPEGVRVQYEGAVHHPQTTWYGEVAQLNFGNGLLTIDARGNSTLTYKAPNLVVNTSKKHPSDLLSAA